MKYSMERKRAALAMVAERGLAYANNELGISKTTLMRWRKEMGDEGFEGQAANGASAVLGENPDDDVSSTNRNSVEHAVATEHLSTESVSKAKCLLNEERDVVLGEIALLIAETDRLTRENKQLRQAIRELIDMPINE